MTPFIPLIIFSVLLNATAQLLLKKAMTNLGELNLSVAFVIKGVFNPYILGGLGVYAISIVSWLIVLAKVNVSVAYPFLALGFVFSVLVAYFAFNEPLTAYKIIGIALICVGLVFLTLSKG